MITDGVTGFLVPAGDPEAFSEKVELLCSQDELRSRMGQAFYEDANRRFSVRSMVETHKRIYTELINGGI